MRTYEELIKLMYNATKDIVVTPEEAQLIVDVLENRKLALDDFEIENVMLEDSYTELEQEFNRLQEDCTCIANEN